MSVKVMGQVWEMDLPHEEKFILLALADHADHNGENARPAVPLIAWKTGYDERHVHRVMAGLRQKGYIEPMRTEPGKPVVYRICPAHAPQLPDYRSPEAKARRRDDKKSPLTECHPCQDVTPTPDKIAPPPCQDVTPSPGRVSPPYPYEPSSNRPLTSSSRTVAGAGAHDGEASAASAAAAENADDGEGEDAAPETAPDLVDRLIAARVNRSDAIRLARDFPERCERQLAYLPYFGPKDSPGAYLRRAIEGDFAPPQSYTALQEKTEARERNRAASDAERARRNAQQEQRTANDQLVERLAEEAQADEETWQAIQDEAAARLHPTLKDRPTHHAYQPALMGHLKAILLERAGMQEPPPNLPARRGAAVRESETTPEPEPPFDKAAADAALEQIRQRRLAGETAVPAAQTGKSAASDPSGVHPQPPATKPGPKSPNFASGRGDRRRAAPNTDRTEKVQ